jgi:ubiquitin-conjugating enzyme E2 O
VSFPNEGGSREIILESELELVDRVLRPGDFCKRRVDDIRSAVVVNMRVRARLVHAISGESVDGWKTASDLAPMRNADIGDYVVCDDWVGQVSGLQLW